MKREILVKVIVDWDNYDDFSDEQILEDTGIYEWLKEGVDITIEKKQPASGSLSKKIPTVQELREAAKDYPDTFLDGALYVVDKYLDAKQPVSSSSLPGTTGYLIYHNDKVNSILGAAMRFLNEEQLICLRNCLIRRTPSSNGR